MFRRRKRTIKLPARGLLDRQHQPTVPLAAFVVDVPWAAVQLTPKGPLVHPSPIDDAITAAANASMRVKLRIGAGIDAPDWAKALDGDPLTVYYTASTSKGSGEVAGTIGRFWMPRFWSAYTDLQAKLAAAYDGSATVAQTSITMAGMIFSETYLRDTKDPRNVDALRNAGFTRAADDTAHLMQMDAHKVWSRTRSGLTFNPYQAIQPDGSVKQDLAYTLSQMDTFRATLGRKAVLENYSLSSDRITASDYAQMYAKMKALGPPFDFQTATLAKVGDLLGVLDWAATWGACSVELPAGYATVGVDALLAAQDKLLANPVG